jgi:hypothetical protein
MATAGGEYVHIVVRAFLNRVKRLFRQGESAQHLDRFPMTGGFPACV